MPYSPAERANFAAEAAEDLDGDFMEPCSFNAAFRVTPAAGCTYATYRLPVSRGFPSGHSISFTAWDTGAVALDNLDRAWKGTLTAARGMARELLRQGYTLDRASVHKPRDGFPPEAAA